MLGFKSNIWLFFLLFVILFFALLFLFSCLFYLWQFYWGVVDIQPLSLSLSLVTKSCPTFATPWTVACQAPLSVGFSRQEYWSWLPFPSPGDLPDPGIELRSPALQADSSPTELWYTISSTYLRCTMWCFNVSVYLINQHS